MYKWFVNLKTTSFSTNILRNLFSIYFVLKINFNLNKKGGILWHKVKAQDY